MRQYRLAAGMFVLVALGAIACGGDSSGPSGGNVICSAGDPVCPPANLSFGYSGPAGSPTIDPTNPSTNITVTSSAFPVVGNTNATANGYWEIVVGNQLLAWGVLSITGGSFFGDIPLFCGSQDVIYTFSNGSGRSYWRGTVNLSSCANSQFRVMLTWDTGPSSDIDLHLIRPSGSVNSGDDCYYGNCQGVALEWGAAGAAGNPLLDVDDTEGWGPENTNILTGAESGVFKVVVRNFDGSAATKATIRIYLDEVEVARYTSQTLDAGVRDYWYVADVNIVSKTVTAVNTYTTSAPFAMAAARPDTK